ncbi:hypothetical protein BpHYR1_051975 [Brachionus plicatilis]|uniref:Uncharacterized protein n=1 Tax=Brachionus plicatilis TaxID=10195 RepID=A0A3M7Q761_BRAPC|nr:hypothetical protein BpHYR1_051975 [Brachionus plicatilis]
MYDQSMWLKKIPQLLCNSICHGSNSSCENKPTFFKSLFSVIYKKDSRLYLKIYASFHKFIIIFMFYIFTERPKFTVTYTYHIKKFAAVDISKLVTFLKHIERSEVLRIEFLFIPICSCQEHELIIKSRCELNA